ncbi:MAG: response regulator [Nitrospiraceae bacterium]|nr:response regulator [Nitrospiraceae bacterium]
MKSSRPIFLVEDDAVDQMLLQRALSTLRIKNRLDVANNGEEALELLGRSKGEDRPCLILIDLNMPRMNGFEFLKALRQDESLRMIPVIVLTTSKEQKDVKESYRLGAAGYMAKPVDYLQFVELVKTIDRYWSLCEQPD